MDRESFERLTENGAFDTFGTFDTDNQEWEMPIPFDEISTPDFPTESLPGTLASFVESVSAGTQTPEEMAGILSLGVCRKSKPFIRGCAKGKYPL